MVFLADLRLLVQPNVSEISESALSYLYRPVWMVRDMFRTGSYFVKDLSDSQTKAAMSYVRGCMGHREEKEIIKHPKLSALWAGVHYKGRWKAAEESISNDHFAMYMYASRSLEERLPLAMHNRMVMESYLETSPAMKLYFSYIRTKEDKWMKKTESSLKN